MTVAVPRRDARATGAANGVRIAVSVAFVLAMALVVLLLVRARPAPDPFDPRSGRPDGARGVVLTLERVGGVVTDTATVPEVGADTRVLVLEDRLDDEQRAALLDLVEAGGVAVVADPDSTLHGGAGVDGGAVEVVGFPLPDDRLDPEVETNVEIGRCTIPELGGLRGVYVPDGVRFPVGPDEPQCFAAAGNAFVIARPLGDGLVVGLGDNEPFVNRHLRRADNAALLARLLVPDTGADVTVLVGRGQQRNPVEVGGGDDTLVDLVPAWVWMGLVLAAIAFVLFAVSAGTRTGRVLAEPLGAPIAGSELVAATGNLMQRARHAGRAGWILRQRLRRDLCAAHHVPLDAPVAELDRTVADRTGCPPGEIGSVLHTDAADDRQLLDLARRIDRLRAATLDPPPDAVPDVDRTPGATEPVLAGASTSDPKGSEA